MSAHSLQLSPQHQATMGYGPSTVKDIDTRFPGCMHATLEPPPGPYSGTPQSADELPPIAFDLVGVDGTQYANAFREFDDKDGQYDPPTGIRAASTLTGVTSQYWDPTHPNWDRFREYQRPLAVKKTLVICLDNHLRTPGNKVATQSTRDARANPEQDPTDTILDADAVAEKASALPPSPEGIPWIVNEGTLLSLTTGGWRSTIYRYQVLAYLTYALISLTPAPGTRLVIDDGLLPVPDRFQRVHQNVARDFGLDPVSSAPEIHAIAAATLYDKMQRIVKTSEDDSLQTYASLRYGEADLKLMQYLQYEDREHMSYLIESQDSDVLIGVLLRVSRMIMKWEQENRAKNLPNDPAAFPKQVWIDRLIPANRKPVYVPPDGPTTGANVPDGIEEDFMDIDPPVGHTSSPPPARRFVNVVKLAFTIRAYFNALYPKTAFPIETTVFLYTLLSNDFVGRLNTRAKIGVSNIWKTWALYAGKDREKHERGHINTGGTGRSSTDIRNYVSAHRRGQLGSMAKISESLRTMVKRRVSPTGGPDQVPKNTKQMYSNGDSRKDATITVDPATARTFLYLLHESAATTIFGKIPGMSHKVGSMQSLEVFQRKVELAAEMCDLLVAIWDAWTTYRKNSSPSSPQWKPPSLSPARQQVLNQYRGTAGKVGQKLMHPENWSKALKEKVISLAAPGALQVRDILLSEKNIAREVAARTWCLNYYATDAGPRFCENAWQDTVGPSQLSVWGWKAEPLEHDTYHPRDYASLYVQRRVFQMAPDIKAPSRTHNPSWYMELYRATRASLVDGVM